MASSTVTLPKSVMSALARDFEMNGEEEILAFLERYPAVLPLLPEIRSKIRSFFGEDAVRLEVFVDPEWEEAPPELFAVIRTKLGPRLALERVHRFDREWWLQRLTEANVPVVVSFDLI